MSERIVDDPSLHGWVDDNGKWVWEGGRDTGHIQDGDTEGQVTTWSDSAREWTPDSTVVVKGGNVGIGTDSPQNQLHIASGGSNFATIRLDAPENSIETRWQLRSHDGVFDVRDIMQSQNRLTIDSTGNVGIGMTPLRSTAKEQLAEWKASFDARLKAEPKADKKAVTLEITDDAFEVLPTEEALAEWMETRAAGDKLQVAGNASFSGTVSAGGTVSASNGMFVHSSNGGMQFSQGNASGPLYLMPRSSTGFSDGVTTLGFSDKRFKDAYFSGTVNASAFVGDGSGLTGVGGGLPPGDFTHNGKITATDFIATSDERVKDNITTAPVGLIDSLKGREWDWKESGEKGSGVVAQELEQVLPHLVHTDDDGMKSVAYNGLVAYLIEEVKALRAEIKEMKS